MPARVVYEGELRCRASCGTPGVELWTDVPAVYGGSGEHPGPMDVLEAALGSCILGVVGLVGARHGLDVSGTSASVCREMDPSGRRIARLQVTISVPVDAPPEARTAIEGAAHVCPVYSALNRDVQAPITFRWGGQR